MCRNKAGWWPVYGGCSTGRNPLLRPRSRPRGGDEAQRLEGWAGEGQRGGTEDLKKKLRDLARDVLDGTVDRGRAAVANQLYNTLIRAIDQERKMKELEDLEIRIEALERAQEKGGKRWPA